VALLAFFSAGDLVNDPAGVTEVIRRLKQLAPRAEQAGLTYGIESWLKVPELERILDAVKSPAIQVYYDVGNMQKVGEDYGAAIRRLGRERICEIHLKDNDDLYGKGTMNFPSVRSALDAIGYRGWIGIEGTKVPLGVEQSIRYDFEYLRPIFPRSV
jgi:L-ribulose-5-phosphate 3-epimerase